MKTKHIIIGLLILMIVLFLMQNKEHAGSTASVKLSNEAIQNIATVYANTDGTATFNNIKATGTATIGGNAYFGGVTQFHSSVKDRGTFFPWTDGRNYIRGMTNIDGESNLSGPTNLFGTTTMHGEVRANGDLYYTKLKGKGEEQRAGTHGLDGNVGGQYTLKCPEGTVMIGIYGWASSVINKIGPICK